MESRLRIVRKKLNLTQEALAQKLGIGKSALSMIETGKAALSERNKNILIKTLGVNREWLETGKGEMFLETDDTYELLNEADMIPATKVPLYDIEGSSGLEKLFNGNDPVKPIGYIRIPRLPKCDGAIYVYGDSMYPVMKSGDIVLFKKLSDIKNIFWGDMYLLSIKVDEEEYVTVKYIQKSENPGFIKLTGHGPNNIEQEIAISKIVAIGFVKATIRMNSTR